MQAGLSDLEEKKVKTVHLLNVPSDICSYIMVDGDVIKEIKYHAPLGEGDKHFVDIYYIDGRCSRMFSIDFIRFE